MGKYFGTDGVRGRANEGLTLDMSIKIGQYLGWYYGKEKHAKILIGATLVKGGHQINDANDLLYRNDSFTWFKGKRINNSNTHGTGCTLSSAIASNLAKGFDLDDSVKRAKDYISGALSAMLDLGKGSGPMDHSFAIDNEYTKEYDG